jgi:hypothetical protein
MFVVSLYPPRSSRTPIACHREVVVQWATGGRLVSNCTCCATQKPDCLAIPSKSSSDAGFGGSALPAACVRTEWNENAHVFSNSIEEWRCSPALYHSWPRTNTCIYTQGKLEDECRWWSWTSWNIHQILVTSAMNMWVTRNRSHKHDCYMFRHQLNSVYYFIAPSIS